MIKIKRYNIQELKNILVKKGFSDEGARTFLFNVLNRKEFKGNKIK